MTDHSHIYREAAEAVARYDLGGPTELAPLGGGTANQNFRVTGTKGSYVLRRRNPRYSSDMWIDYEAEYLNHLFAAGLPVPVPLTARDGDIRVRVGENVYQLYTEIRQGEPFQADNIKQIAAAGAFAGKLHSALRSFRPKTAKPLPRYDDPAVSAQVIAETVGARAADLSADERELLDYVKAKTDELCERLPDSLYNRLPHTVIHGDYHPGNVGFADGEVCAVFDFDWISWQPRIRDVGDGIIYFSAIRPEPFDGGNIYSLTRGCTFDFERSAAVVAAYQQAASEPLTAEELACLPLFMAARLIYSRIQALPKIPEERHVEMLTKEIAIPLDWLEEHGERYVRHLREACGV